MSVNSENIPAAKQKQLRKNPLYIYWEFQTLYSTSYLKLDNTHLLHLFVDMYILKFFLRKNILFFAISQKPFDQNISLTPLSNNN